MKPGSSDSLMTLLGSVLLTFLLFVARHVLDMRAPTRTSDQAHTQWHDQDRQQTPNRDFGGQPSTRESPKPDWDPLARSKSASQTSAAQPSEHGSGTTTVSASTSDVQADTFKVISVLDGDTADVLVNQKPVRLRFNGIDTPEKGQPFGTTAKDALTGLIGGKYIRYVVRDTDRYGRNIADLYIDGVYVNKWMVEQGLAWHYVAYSNDPDLAAAELGARNARRGLWADPRRVPPWNWRKLSKVERDAYR